LSKRKTSLLTDVNRRRLFLLALLVTALLAVVAIVAGGRPLGKDSGTGAGLPATFWDFVFTTAVIVGVLLVVAAFSAFFFFRRDRRMEVVGRRTKSRELRGIVLLILVAGLILWRHHDLQRLHLTPPSTTARRSKAADKGPRSRSPVEHVHFRWEELVVVLFLLLTAGVVAGATRSRLGPRTNRRPPPEVLAAALDESLDDLRADPDLRRAIIAAYARMESALAVAGIPREPAEAPLEYLERALLSLDASASAVRRLTDLFEWARFSQHEPDPSMRDEAVDALVAVRDELRASELTPA
jgi:Domain of unknown function (DUF4129)